jgi:Tetracyclin repressor-like, C-terminal domain
LTIRTPSPDDWPGARLLAQTPDPPVAELVAAFAGPLFDEMPAAAEGGARTSRLIVTIFSDPAEEMRNWTGPAENTVRDRYPVAACLRLVSRPEVQARGTR